MIATGLTINGVQRSVTAHPDTPLLWVLRENLKLTGTKYGCGVGQCGACTVHVDGRPAFSCLLEIQHVCAAQARCRERTSQNTSRRIRRRLDRSTRDFTLKRAGSTHGGPQPRRRSAR